jgi:hypothetical protein
LRLAQIFIGFERLITATWPVWTIALLLLSLVWLGIFEAIPSPIIRLTLLGVMVTLGLFFLIRGLYRFKIPTKTDARIRMDQITQGRYLLLLDHHAEQSALWNNAHQQAQEAVIGQYPPLKTTLSKSDQFGLRFIPVLLCASAFLLVPFDLVIPRFKAAFSTQMLQSRTATVEGWITPPSYTGKPPIYLSAQTSQTLRIPSGSKLVLKIFNINTPPKLDDVSFTPLPQQHAFEGEGTLTESMTLKTPDPALPVFTLKVIPDRAPEITLTQQPFLNKNNELEFQYTVSDDYGRLKTKFTILADEWSAEYNLRSEPQAQTEDLTFAQDLTSHPYAGKSVRLELSVTDAIGQIHTQLSQPVTLPVRTFTEPMAKAIIEQRRNIVFEENPAQTVEENLHAIIKYPDTYFTDIKPYLLIQKARQNLDENTKEAVDALWQAAVLLEQGDLANAAEQLQRARDRLEDAIQRGASQEEISQLMQELRQAIQNYLAALAQSASGQQEQNGDSDNKQTLTQEDLEKLLEELEKAAASGSPEQASRMLDMLSRLLEAIRPSNSGQDSESGSGENSNGLSKQQDQLSRDTFDVLRDQNGLPNTSGQELQPLEELEKRQEALRNALPDGEETDDIEKSMKNAQSAIRNNDLDEAIRQQQKALDGLRQYEKNQSLNNTGGESNQQTGRSGQTDPLGRAIGQSQGQGGKANLDSSQSNDRSRALSEEIRRRSENTSPDSEAKEYLDDLLDAFE